MADVKEKDKDFPIEPFAISEPVFGSCVSVYIGCSYANMLKDITKGKDLIVPDGYEDPEKHKDSNGVCLSCDSKSGATYNIIWVRHQNLKTLERMGHLLHECIHLCQFIFKRKGVNTSADEPEPMAYMTEFYFTSILKESKQ